MPEVGGSARVKVDLRVNFVDARQWVHDNRALLGLGEDIVVDDEHVLDGLVLGNVVESFLLDSSNVENVGSRDDLVEVVVFVPLDTGSRSFRLDALGHSERWGGDKVESDIVEREDLDE